MVPVRVKSLLSWLRDSSNLVGWIALIAVGAVFHKQVMIAGIIGGIIVLGMIALDIYKKRTGK